LKEVKKWHNIECREDKRESRALLHTNIHVTGIREKGIPGVLG